MTDSITPELRELIEPHLKDHLDPDSWQYIDQMFDEVVYTQPGEVPLVTLNPVFNYPAMMFSCITGEFIELTNWDYIQTVDVEEERREREEKERKRTIICALKHYHKIEFQIITDYYKVIEAREEVEPGIFEYNCPGQTIYLNADNYPVTRGNQKTDGEYYYYNFSSVEYEAGPDDDDFYNYMVPYEWKKYNSPGE